MPRLSARLVEEPYWDATAEGSRPVEFTGDLAGTRTVVLQFLLDGSPIDRSQLWDRAPQLVAPGITACLRGLRKASETLVLSQSSAPRHERQFGGHILRLRSEDIVYLDYIVPGLVENFAWLATGDEDSRESELVFEVVDEILEPVVRLCFDWNSFRGYVVLATELPRVREWPFAFRDADWIQRRIEELAVATLFFEDWADGCALRLWSRALSAASLQARVRLDTVNAALTTVEVG